MTPDGTTKPAMLECDIFISGGSFSAPAAALAAARTNPEAEIILTEPTDLLGGQATSQGVSAIDNAWHDPGASIMRNDPSKYYPADYLEWLDGITSAPAEAPGKGMGPRGTCWVSRESYDPRTAAWVLDTMVARHPRIRVLKMTVVKRAQVSADGSRVTALTLIKRTPRPGYTPHSKLLSVEFPDWYSPADSADFTKETVTVAPRDAARGMVVVEASETGDLLVLTGDQYTVGRETKTEDLGADGSLPPFDEDGSQATVFPFCMTGADKPDPEAHLRSWFPKFDDYLEMQTRDYFSLGAHTWERVWTYRRLLAVELSPEREILSPGDVTMQNWYPGNDYPYGSPYMNKSAAAAQLADWQGGLVMDVIAGAEIHALAWYFYLKQTRPTAWDTRYLHGAHELNMMGTAHGLAKFPYIRCMRRGVGLHGFRILEASLRDTASPEYPGGTSHRFYDSVGIGAYAVDVHATSETEGLEPAFEKAAPFYIPYRALASGKVANMLYAGKAIATTYITNAAYRLHPIEWAIGSASGTAAGMMSRNGSANRDLLAPPQLRALQAAVNENSPISWAAFDKEPLPAHGGDLMINGATVEVTHYGARSVRIRHGNADLGEAKPQGLGRFSLQVTLEGVRDGASIEAVILGDDGVEIETLAAPILPKGASAK